MMYIVYSAIRLSISLTSISYSSTPIFSSRSIPSLSFIFTFISRTLITSTQSLHFPLLSAVLFRYDSFFLWLEHLDDQSVEEILHHFFFSCSGLSQARPCIFCHGLSSSDPNVLELFLKTLSVLLLDPNSRKLPVMRPCVAGLPCPHCLDTITALFVHDDERVSELALGLITAALPLGFQVFACSMVLLEYFRFFV